VRKLGVPDREAAIAVLDGVEASQRATTR